MKKLFYHLLLVLIIVTPLQAQQLELHYDTRHSLYGSHLAGRNYLTGTFEIFKPDTFGSTFVLFDFNFDNTQVSEHCKKDDRVIDKHK